MRCRHRMFVGLFFLEWGIALWIEVQVRRGTLKGRYSLESTGTPISKRLQRSLRAIYSVLQR